ncbi:MAG: hypothetical protein ACFFD4_16045 [Candidatus Odinarchaeota archaeon]
MTTLVNFKQSLTVDEKGKLVESIRQILRKQNQSKIMPRIFSDPWDEKRYLIQVGYFDRGTLDEIEELPGITELIDIECEDKFSELESIVYELKRVIKEKGEFKLTVFELNQSNFQKNTFISLFHKLNLAKRVVEDSTDHYYLELMGNSYRIGKFKTEKAVE